MITKDILTGCMKSSNFNFMFYKVKVNSTYETAGVYIHCDIYNITHINTSRERNTPS